MFLMKVIKKFINSTYNYEIKTSKLTVLWSATNALFPFFGIFGAFASGFFCDHFGRQFILLRNYPCFKFFIYLLKEKINVII
jgi:hypothetical protein